jgi:antitoxin (DNA-binding transcriptional repressor) of toxin-antitoxin stability system
MRTINASEFKSKCLSILDEVHESGEGITVLKRGKPVAQLLPALPSDDTPYPQRNLKGTVTIMGDILSPPLPPETWEAEKPDP